MTSHVPTSLEAPALTVLRRLLLATLIFGTAGMEQFRREMGKYVDKAEVARLERYVIIN